MELKIGNYVLFKSIDIPNWTSDMDYFRGKLVCITDVYNRGVNTYFRFEGHLTHRTWQKQHIEKVFETEQEGFDFINERKKKREEVLKTMIYEIEHIYEIAKDVFSEDRLYKDDINNYIYIHYPEILITNSKNETHTIKDLYVRIHINIILNLEGIDMCFITLAGRRMNVSIKEWQSQYGHSHISNCFSDFSNFCLGSSDFALTIGSLQLSLTKEDWYLFFLSIDNYVSWESLEGGPYRKIANISYVSSISGSEINSELKRLIRNIPNKCFKYTDKLDVLTTHPSLLEYYDNESRIRSITSYTDDQLEEIKNIICIKGLVLDGKTIPFQLYYDKSKTTNLSKDIIDTYNSILKEKLINFNKKIGYDNAKSNQKVFTESGIE